MPGQRGIGDKTTCSDGSGNQCVDTDSKSPQRLGQLLDQHRERRLGGAVVRQMRGVPACSEVSNRNEPGSRAAIS